MPLIVWSVLGALWTVSPVVAYVAIGLTMVFYFWLSPPLAVGMLGVIASMVWPLTLLGSRALSVSIAVFVAAWIGQFWEQCSHVLRRGWRGLALGGLGYPALQVVLLWSCLVALQVDVAFGAVLAAYAVERMLTLVPITPGGVGVVETAATAVLVGFGADPVGAAAGVVLFRVFSYLIEIPLGAVVAATWFAQTRRMAARTALAA